MVFKAKPIVPRIPREVAENPLDDLTPLQLRFIKAYIKNNYKVKPACAEVGMHYHKYYHWKNNVEQFQRAMTIFREAFIDDIENAFKDLVEDRNPQAVIFGLKTLAKERGYVERTEVLHAGVSKIQIEMLEPGEKEDDEDIKPVQESAEDDDLAFET